MRTSGAKDKAGQRTVLTIGNFDGVHRGHVAIAAAARRYADARGLPVVALTFEPHPLEILRPGAGPQRLGTPEEKLAALHAAGIDRTVVVESTPEFLNIAADAFVRDVVMTRFRPVHIVEGHNFGFGQGRSGDVETLRKFGAEFGYTVEVVPPVQQRMPDGTEERVSSSLIRKLLLAGEVALASAALGRPYALAGEVVTGSRRGRMLGFPTANVAVRDVLIPADGVYAGIAEFSGGKWRAAVSIGRALTFDEDVRQIEAHLLDFDGDLYDQALTLRLVRRLRGQRKFASGDELMEQIARDVAEVRQVTI